MSKNNTCCCPSHDPQECFELRYYNYSPAVENKENREQCECSCHDSCDECGAPYPCDCEFAWHEGDRE